jgi:hypothetical protein
MKMKMLIATAAAALALAGAPTVAGTWAMSIDSPHGNMKTSPQSNRTARRSRAFRSQIPT